VSGWVQCGKAKRRRLSSTSTVRRRIGMKMIMLRAEPTYLSVSLPLGR
jgi:hypothetical protein